MPATASAGNGRIRRSCRKLTVRPSASSSPIASRMAPLVAPHATSVRSAWRGPWRVNLDDEGLVDVAGRDDDVREVPVRGMQRELQIRLLGTGGKAGAGPTALPEEDDRAGSLGDGGEAEAFRHQRKPGAGSRGGGPHAHVRRADRHVDAGDLVL